MLSWNIVLPPSLVWFDVNIKISKIPQNATDNIETNKNTADSDPFFAKNSSNFSYYAYKRQLHIKIVFFYLAVWNMGINSEIQRTVISKFYKNQRTDGDQFCGPLFNDLLSFQFNSHDFCCFFVCGWIDGGGEQTESSPHPKHFRFNIMGGAR